MEPGIKFRAQSSDVPFFAFQSNMLLRSEQVIEPSNEIILYVHSDSGILNRMTVNVLRAIADNALTLELTTESPIHKTIIQVSPSETSRPLPNHSKVEVVYVDSH